MRKTPKKRRNESAQNIIWQEKLEKFLKNFYALPYKSTYYNIIYAKGTKFFIELTKNQNPI